MSQCPNDPNTSFLAQSVWNLAYGCIGFGYSSKEFSNPLPHPVGHLAKNVLLAHPKSTLYLISTSIQNQTHSGRIHRTVDQIDQAPDADGCPPTNRQIKNLLSQLRNTL